MVDPNPNVTLLDQTQILQGSYDGTTQRLRVDAEVTSNLGTVVCVIDNSSDSIALGTSTQLFTATTVGPKIGLDVNVTNALLDTEIKVGGVVIDPRSIRTLTSSDIVTSNQGSANTLSNAWPVKLTDGSGILIDPRLIRALTSSDIVTALLKDDSGNPFSNINPLPTNSGISSGGVFGNIVLTTANTAYELKVGGSRLTNRRSATISVVDLVTIYWGYSDTVTTSTGTPLTTGTFKEWALNPSDSSVQIWLVSGTDAQNVRITESP